MRRSTSSTPTASDDDLDYQTDPTSAEQSSEECIMSDVQESDEEDILEDRVRPPEFYRRHAEKVNKIDVLPPYADSTTLHLNSIQEQWEAYCAHIVEHPTELMQSLTIGDAASFFRWKLDRTRGKGGRKLRGTKDASSLSTYWKQFLRVYRRVAKRDMDSETMAQTRTVLSDVAREYGLSHTPRDKPPMDVYDVREVLQTAITTTEKMFKVGRYRIQTCFFVQGGFITANRPEALLKLQYQHIKVTILRDPRGGPHRILLELTYEFTKTFLGPKAPNTFPIPEILFDPSLVLSPHVFLLGLMFADDVFPRLEGAPRLTPEHLSQLDIRPGCNALELPIRQDMADTYVFRQCTPSPTGWTISKKRLPDSTLRPHLKDIGEITGLKEVARPYCLRYGSAKAFDQDGNTSESLRNLIMRHADTRTFLNHYLSRRITADTQAIVRGMAPQDEIMQAACRMSRWIDPDRPRHLTPEQSASVNQDPRVQRLLRQQEKCRGKSSQREAYEKLGKEIRNERQRLRHALRIHIRRNWDREQAERDIQQQLSGVTFGDRVKTRLQRCSERSSEHNRLIECVLSLPGSSLEEESHRRSSAINAIIAYCKVEEGETRRIHRAASSVRRKESPDAMDPLDAALELAKVSVYKEKRPTICFMCLGNENALIEDRIYSFSTSGDLSKHFKLKHLAKI